MVSLSSTEMLKNMVENYGYGSYLFSQLSMEQLEKLQEIKPDFSEYLQELFSGKIYDPDSLDILEQKYKNDLWIHQPSVYDLEIESKEIDQWIEMDDVNLLLAKLLQFVKNKIEEINVLEFRKGDVIYLNNQKLKLESYYIYSDLMIQNVYFKYKSLEIVEPIQYMNILGSTPVNYWNEVGIPKLSFEFDLGDLLDQISWTKLKLDKNQNYLVGEMVYQKRKVHLMVPIGSKNQFKSSADKLAVQLQITNRKIFLTKDPKNIIPSHPLIFFADIDLAYQFMENEQDEEIDFD